MVTSLSDDRLAQMRHISRKAWTASHARFAELCDENPKAMDRLIADLEAQARGESMAHEIDKAVSRLDDQSDLALFEMLDDQTQERLEIAFTATLDEDDIWAGIFHAIDPKNNGTPERLERLWRDYLRRQDLRNRYRDQLDEAAREREEEEPERFDGLS